MGYYTRFKLGIIAKDRIARDLKDSFYEDVECGKAKIEYLDLDALLQGNSDSMKWYQWEEDMKTLSRQYPNLIFQLDGVGREEEIDVWRAFFKNGKNLVQTAELKFEEPDLSRLD